MHASSSAHQACYSYSAERERGRYTAAGQLEAFLKPQETLSAIVLSPVLADKQISVAERLDASCLDKVLDAQSALELMNNFSFFQNEDSPPYALTAWTDRRVIWLARRSDGLRFEAVDTYAPAKNTICKNDLG